MKPLLILLVFAVDLAFGQHPLQSIQLKAGSYAVGFRSAVYYDLGRPPLKEQQSGLRNGRVVHLSVWYPANVKSGERWMPFQEYVNDVARMVNPEPVTVATQKESVRLMKFFLSQLHGDTSVLNNHLAALLASPTKACSNAAAVKENFPVVFYPESSYQNNILCEYLASHGYIVVSVSRHGTFDVEFEWQTVKGIETLTQDCEFALSIIKNEFKLVEPNLAVMGVGMNASAGLAWMMRNPEVDALISLEGGIITGYEYSLIQKSPYFNKTRVTKPMLIMHSPHEAVNPDLIDNYKYADRHMLHLPRMSEFYYLNYGVWESTMTGILGPSPGDTKAGFECAARYTLNFLDWQLKHKESGKTFFTKTPEQNGIKSDIATYTLKPRFTVPLTDAELDALRISKGFDTMLAETSKYLQEDPLAFSFETFIVIGQKLITAKEYEHGLRWAAQFQTSYPEATSAFTISGRCYLELNKRTEATAMYTKALQLLPSDHRFEPADKEQLRLQIVKRLEQLKS